MYVCMCAHTHTQICMHPHTLSHKQTQKEIILLWGKYLFASQYYNFMFPITLKKIKSAKLLYSPRTTENAAVHLLIIKSLDLTDVLKSISGTFMLMPWGAMKVILYSQAALQGAELT